ncbi:hypothetical protein MSAN_00957600 [Mycena sanguinolenta]|uniref:Uncharacterized protein n=1 Tax=Mycena sanguinolenta TaxID=230812 RepID=A0A8H7DCE8_9AGAR|nr:hypothetical protein MSAN_00957600 [Mycena sanguinolenta]
MDLQPHSEPESTVVFTTNNTDSAAYAGAFFSRATRFNICGGVFTSNVTNNVYNPPSEPPTAFRTVLLGDINLIKEFKEMRSGPQSSLVGRQIPGASVRRVYMAKIEGRESGYMTVAVYEGDGAEEAWSQHLASYESIRHPHIMQLYGLVRTRRLRGMVFHDALVPYGQFLRRFQHSPILSTYIIGYCTMEFREATKYMLDAFPKFSMNYDKMPVWIRPSTGELCLDLAQGWPGTRFELPWWQVRILRLENVSLDAPDSEDMIISSLREDQYHKLCSGYPVARFRCFQVSTEHLVGPGIFRLDSQYGTCTRITEPLVLPEEELCWNWNQDGAGELLANSWIRYDFRRTRTLALVLQFSFRSYEIPKTWLAQANRIFAELEEEAHLADYVCVDRVQFILRCSPNKRHIDAEGYLFVCPPRDFHSDNKARANLYQWPHCPAYWSLDASGADRLTTEDARIFGFPAIHTETMIVGRSWDRNVYRGLRRFHQGKGFNPDGAEVLRQLGYTRYEVLNNRVPFPARNLERYSCREQDPGLCRELGHYL